MKDWQTTLVLPETPIIRVVHIIDDSRIQIALVVDEERRLKGTVTDGDIRRAILNRRSLDDPVSTIMFKQPTTANIDSTEEDIINMMRNTNLKQIPVLDYSKRVVGLKLLVDMIQIEKKQNAVVLMAGGMGKRLRPMTNDCPKPLLTIGNKPILQNTIENFISCGFNKFYISVYYKAEMIEKHFGDGSEWNVKIDYLREEKQLGTAGALSMLRGQITEPLLLMNGDLVTKLNFQHILNYHTNISADATMAIYEYDIKVPYGVVEIADQYLVRIDEKPAHKFFVNAGIYVLEPDLLDLIPWNTHFDITDLFDNMLENKHKIATFPIREYWSDIGQIKDYEQTKLDCEVKLI